MTQYLKQLEVTSIRICWGTVKRAQNSYLGEKKPEKLKKMHVCSPLMFPSVRGKKTKE